MKKFLQNSTLFATIATACILFGCMLIACGEKKRTFKGVLNTYGLDAEDILDFTILQELDINEKQKNLKAECKGHIIRLKVLTQQKKETTEQYIKGQNLLINNLFTPVAPPYPELSGQEIACGEEFKPVLQKNKTGEYLKLFAGRRLGYGICSKDLIAYTATLKYLYCEKRETLFVIEHFTPIQEPFNEKDALIHGFTCILE